MFRRFIISSWAIIWRNSRPLSSLISHEATCRGIFFAFPTRRHFSNFLRINLYGVRESEAAKKCGKYFHTLHEWRISSRITLTEAIPSVVEVFVSTSTQKDSLRMRKILDKSCNDRDSSRTWVWVGERERVERNGKLQFSTRKLANWRDGISAVKTIENLINWLDLVWVSIPNHRSPRFN